MNNLLVIMCLMGSISYLFYLILCKILGYRFQPKQRLLLLIVSLCFYLVPVPLLKNSVRNFVNFILNRLQLQEFYMLDTGRVHMERANNIIFKNSNGRMYLPYYSTLRRNLFALWICIVLIVICIYAYKYRKYKKYWLACSTKVTLSSSGHFSSFFKRKVQVRILDQSYAPFSVGIFSPMIFVPSNISNENMDFIMQHEYLHIKHYHGVLKIIGLITALLYWYCPLTWLFVVSLNNTLELVCDENVLKECTPLQRTKYVELILDSAVAPNSVFSSAFKNSNFKFTKERILMIKHFSSKKHVVSFILVVTASLLSASPVLAYQPIVKSSMYSDDIHQYRNDDYFEFLSFEDPKNSFVDQYTLPTMETDNYLTTHDSYLLFEDGELLFPNEYLSAKSICPHSWKTATYTRHFGVAPSGCSVKYYKAKACPKCGTIASTTFLYEVNYAKCPHK